MSLRRLGAAAARLRVATGGGGPRRPSLAGAPPPPALPGVHPPAGEGVGGAWPHHRGGPHDSRPLHPPSGRLETAAAKGVRRRAQPRPRRSGRGDARAGRAPPPASTKPTRPPGAYAMSGTPSPTAPSKVEAGAAAPLPSRWSSVPARTPETLLVAGAPTRFRRRRECVRAISG